MYVCTNYIKYVYYIIYVLVVSISIQKSGQGKTRSHFKDPHSTSLTVSRFCYQNRSSTGMYVCMHVCMNVSIYACMHACMHVCTNERNSSKTVQSNQSECMPKRKNIQHREVQNNQSQHQGSKFYMTSITSLKHLQFSVRTDVSRPEPLYVYRDPYRYVREVVSK